MRIAKRQKGQNAFAVENLPRHRIMRFFRANGRYQRVMLIIPESQRNIGFVAQPGISAIRTDHQTSR